MMASDSFELIRSMDEHQFRRIAMRKGKFVKAISDTADALNVPWMVCFERVYGVDVVVLLTGVSEVKAYGDLLRNVDRHQGISFSLDSQNRLYVSCSINSFMGGED